MNLLVSALFLIAGHQDYFDLIEKHPILVEPRGEASKGEIEILLDPVKIAAIEKKMGRKVGIVATDPYWTWLNDAVLFPSGIEGIYARMIYTQAKGDPRNAGVAVFAILPNGKIVLNCNHRHATRSWEIELPRGGINNSNETCEELAIRKVKQETGMNVDSIALLGEITPNTGMQSIIVPIYEARVVKKEASMPEYSEAIENVFALSIQEIQEAFISGFYEMTIRGQTQKIPFRDPFLAYALLLHTLRK